MNTRRDTTAALINSMISRDHAEELVLTSRLVRQGRISVNHFSGNDYSYLSRVQRVVGKKSSDMGFDMPSPAELESTVLKTLAEFGLKFGIGIVAWGVGNLLPAMGWGDAEKDGGEDRVNRWTSKVDSFFSPPPMERRDIAELVSKSAAQSGVKSSMLYAVLGNESGFRTDIKAETSSAQGIAQFTNGTWREMSREMPELGLKPEDRNDPEKASYVAGVYLRKIQDKLRGVLRRDPTDGETYLGYFLGPGGATRFLALKEKNPDFPADELFPQAASANRHIFYDRNGQPRTLQEVLDLMENKMRRYSTEYIAMGIAEQPIGTSSPTSPSVQVADGSGNSVKKSGGHVEIEEEAAEQAQQVAAITSTSQPKPKWDAPFRGRDGRLYVAQTS